MLGIGRLGGILEQLVGNGNVAVVDAVDVDDTVLQAGGFRRRRVSRGRVGEGESLQRDRIEERTPT